MNGELRGFAVAITSAVLAFALGSGVTATSLKAWLETPHQQYKFCERFYAYLFVENSGSDTTDVYYVDDWCVVAPRLISFRLTDESGNEIEDGGLFSDPTPNDTVHLAPGDTALFVFDVLGVYGKGGFHTKYPHCLPTGKYTLEGKYMVDIPLAPIQFEICPLNQAEEEQIAIFTKVWNSTLNGKERFDAWVEAYEELKNTVFGDFACELVFKTASPSVATVEQRIHFAREYLDRYASKGATDVAIRTLCASLASKERVDFIKKIPAMHTDLYLRLRFKTTCALDEKMELFFEVMK